MQVHPARERTRPRSIPIDGSTAASTATGNRANGTTSASTLGATASGATCGIGTERTPFVTGHIPAATATAGTTRGGRRSRAS